jgi:hypothetical protein
MNFKELLNNVVVQEALIRRQSRGEDYIEYLEHRGWNIYGEGSYGTVLDKPSKNYVLKVFADKGYNTFLNFIEQNQHNPNLAKIKRKIIKSNSNELLGVVAIEKLKPVNSKKYAWISDITGHFARFINSYRDSADNRSFEEVLNSFRETYTIYKSSTYQKYKDHLKAGNNLGSYEKRMYLTSRRGIDRLDFFIENYLPIAQTLYELCTYVQKNAHDSWFDLHLGNFMIRPSTNEIVITDPLI